MTEPAETFSAGSLAGATVDEPYPGVLRRAFDSPRATVTRYEFAPGARFPQHRHSQEQITLVEQGTVELTVAGHVRQLAVDDWAVVAPNVEHGMRAGESGARFVAIVVPRRSGPQPYTVLAEEP